MKMNTFQKKMGTVDKIYISQIDCSVCKVPDQKEKFTSKHCTKHNLEIIGHYFIENLDESNILFKHTLLALMLSTLYTRRYLKK
jgi:hypothetical protein